MSGEKTEKPTPRRLEDQRKEGQVPQRKNVVEAALLTYAVLALIGFSGPLSNALLNLSTVVFLSLDGDFDDARASSFTASMDVVWLMLAVSASISLFTLLVGMFLNKFLFAPKAVSIKFQKLNPVSQLKNIFSKATIYNFIRLLVYFSALSLLLYIIVVSSFEDSINASYCGGMCLYPLFLSRIRIAVTVILIVLVVLAIVDYLIQDRLFISQNKMTKDEVKREYKGQEGDPEIKARRKSIAMNDAAMPLPSDATHVVHSDQVLVAMIFYPTSGQRPFMVFKAKGPRVPSLCRQFRALKIPTVNLPGAALDLYRMAPPGQYLPARSARSIQKVMRMMMQS